MKRFRTWLVSRWTLVFFALALCPMACQGGCEEEKKRKKGGDEESASSEESTPGGSPAGAKRVDRPTAPVAAPTASEVPVLMKKGPEKLHLGTASLAMPSAAAQQGALYLKPLMDSGLTEIVLSALPADAKQEWKSALDELGFDPLTAIAGAILWSDGKDYDKLDLPGINTRGIVVGKNGGLAKAITIAIKDDSSDENDDPFEENEIQILFSDTFTANQINEIRTQLLAKFKRETPEAEQVDVAFDESHILIGRTNKKVVAYYYLSPNGVAVGTDVGYEGSAQDAAAARLAPFFKEINQAAKLNGYPKGFSKKRVLQIHLTRKNEVIDGSLDVDQNLDLQVSVPKEALDLPGEMDQLISTWNLIKVAPDQILGELDIPPAVKPMLVKLIKGTDLGVKNGVLSARVRIPLQAVKDGIAQLIR